MPFFKKLFDFLFKFNTMNIDGVFKWNEGFKKINSLFEEIITPDKLTALKENPPIHFPPEDLGWLGRITQLGSADKEIRDNLKQKFSEIFSHIRLYHACCPPTVSSYYENGFKLLVEEEQKQIFHEIFSPHVSEEDLNRAIEEVDEFYERLGVGSETRKKICFCFDKRYTDEICGEFMLGAEYLRHLVSHLPNLNQEAKQKLLLKDRIPTVFIVDMPIQSLNKENLSSLIGHIASKWIGESLRKEKYPIVPSCMQLDKISPEYIYDHYHLQEIICRHKNNLNQQKVYCDKCQQNISYHVKYGLY